MELNKDQIQELYRFTRQHFVEWYDLQTELVDHLANDIENILAENSNFTFNEAKDKSFRKFGVCGFQDVIESKQKALRKKYWLLVWQFFKDYFKLPKIILTIGLAGLVYTFIKTMPYKENIVIVVLFIYVLLPFIFFIKKSGDIKKHQKLTGKKWLFEDAIKTLGGFLFILQISYQIFLTIHRFSNWPQYYFLIFSLFFVLGGFFFYIGFSLIPKKMENLMEQQFPEYNQLQKA